MRDILFISVYDWANIGCSLAIAGRKAGLDCLSIVKIHHPFNYLEKSTLYSELGLDIQEESDEKIKSHPYWDGFKWNTKDYYAKVFSGLQTIVDQFRIIIMMHSWNFQIKKRDYHKWAVFHGGTAYREGHEYMCEIFNKIMDITLIQTGELFGHGAYNERWLLPPLDTDAIKPVFSNPIGILRIGHNPRDPGGKGSQLINEVMEKFKDRCNYVYSAGRVSWIDNLKRMSEYDVYIESLGIAGEWGLTALEAAALGKVVITQFKSLDRYEKEYNCKCPILVANTQDELTEQIEKVLSFSPEDVIDLQKRTRDWVENTHGYVPTGLRLKGLLL